MHQNTKQTIYYNHELYKSLVLKSSFRPDIFQNVFSSKFYIFQTKLSTSGGGIFDHFSTTVTTPLPRLTTSIVRYIPLDALKIFIHSSLSCTTKLLCFCKLFRRAFWPALKNEYQSIELNAKMF